MLIVHCFVIISSAILITAVQVARISPSPVGDASHRFRHDSYVDKKVRAVAVNILNHQAYHQRNVIFPSSASIFPTTVIVFTNATLLLSDVGIQLQPPSTTIASLASLGSFSRDLGLSDIRTGSGIPSRSLQAALSSPSNNLSIGVPSAGRASQQRFRAPVSSFRPSSLTVDPLRPTNLTGLRATASRSFLNASTQVIFARPTGLGTSAPSDPLNVAFDVLTAGSTGYTYTASRYNSSVATGIGPVVPPPIPSSYLSRYAAADRLDLTSDLALAANVGTSWKEATNSACSSRLAKPPGLAVNPSGILPCYNVRTLNSYTGVFSAELRLYRLTPASGDWAQLRNDGVTIGMAYQDATVTRQGTVGKRDVTESRQHDKRADTAAPQLLQTLPFVGQVNDASIPKLVVETAALALLTPKINLAGTTRNGIPISTQLSIQDASFVNGVFADLSSTDTVGSSTMDVGSKAWLIKANTFSKFPLSLLLVTLWSVILFAMEGYDLLRKLKCRTDDRKRMMSDGSSRALIET